MRLSTEHRETARTGPSMRVTPRLRPAVGLAALLALLPLVTVALLQLTPTSPSPATGHAQVIAHGVAPLPGQSLVWRVVQDTAEPRDQAVVEERALGFALADQDAVLVYDQGIDRQVRLAGGEAAFVPGGSLQQRSSLGEAPAPYYRIALVPAAQAADAGGDQLIFAGDPWNAPAGEEFDLDLIRNVIAPNESATIPAPNGLTVILVTEGVVEIAADATATVRLEAGQAATFAGEVEIAGVGLESATYVAAMVGPEVPPPPAPPTGSITINVLGCPSGLTAAEAVNAGFSADVIGDCQPTALPADPLLILAGDQPLAPDQPSPDQGSYTWNLLLYSPFPVADFELPAGYDSYLLVNANGIVKASEGSGLTPTVPDPDVLFVNGQVPNAQATLFLFAGDDGGSISLAPFTCPEGMTLENFDGDNCEPAAGSFEFLLTSVTTGATWTMADATGNPGSPFLTWRALPPGEYMIDVPVLPTGFTTIRIPGLAVDAAFGSYTVTLTEEIPDAQYNVFFLQEGDAGAAGTITATVYNCPPGMGRDALEPASCQPASGFDLNLYPPTGGVLRMTDASVQGNTVTWTNLPFAEYGIEEVLLPAGYTDAFAPEVPTSRLSDRVYAVTVSEASPGMTISIYNLAGPTPSPAGDD